MYQEEFIRLIRAKVREYDEARIYYTLRMLNFRYITERAIRAIQIFLALKELGFTFVTPNLLAAVMNIAPNNARALLHRLGDKKVLTLVRDRSRSFRYILSTTFLRHFETKNLNISSNLDSNTNSLRKGNGGVAPKQDENMEVE